LSNAGTKQGFALNFELSSSTGESGGRLTTDSGVGNHRFNWLDSSNWLFGERESESDSAEQLSVYVNRTTTHALHDPSLLEWSTAEPGEDDALLWREVFEDTEDLDLELFDLISTENGAADTALTGTDIFERKERLSEDRQREHDEQGEEAAREPSAFKSRPGGQLTHISHCSEGWFAIAL
jgi:hypothetical protein